MTTPLPGRESNRPCGHVDTVTSRRCDRSQGHPGNHTDEPNGDEW